MYEPFLRDKIWAEGRGPELRRAYFRGGQFGLIALEYVNPDWSSEADIKHLILHRTQAHLYTPEEVYNVTRDEVRWGPPINQAAIVNLGKSEWLLSFSQRHLARCNHYRLMFYDEYLDVICENITAGDGPYQSSAH